jgi:GcrA cell cycle regulator
VAGWTDAEVAQLRNLYTEGLTCSAIAGETGRTRNAVIGKLGRIGLAGAPDRVRKPRARRLGGIADQPARS